MKTTKSLFYSRTTRRQSVLNLIKSPARKRVPFALRLMGGLLPSLLLRVVLDTAATPA